MLGQDARPGGRADAGRTHRIQRGDQRGDLAAVARDQDLGLWLEEQLDALPGIGDQAAAGACRLAGDFDSPIEASSQWASARIPMRREACKEGDCRPSDF